MRTGQDDSVGQEGQGHFRMKYHIGVVCAGSNSSGRTIGRKARGKVVKDEQGATKVAGMLRNEPGAL